MAAKLQHTAFEKVNRTASYHPWVGYASALLVQAAITLALIQLGFYISDVVLRAPYTIALIAVAFFFGTGPGIMALVAGIAGFIYYLIHAHQFSWEHGASVGGWMEIYVFSASLLLAGLVATALRISLIRFQQLAEDLERSRRELEEALERERGLSISLQRALVPPNPSIAPGYRVAAEYIPAYAEQEIGGDFFDVFPVSDDKVGILIGDVSGKGIEAAALAAATRSTIHTLVHETGSAAISMTRANVILNMGSRTGSFVTVYLAILESATGKIVYTSAGHPPAVVQRSDSSVELLWNQHVPIGLLEGQVYEQEESYLHPGDRLLLYTDGIMEARKGTLLFGVEGIEQVVRERRDCSPEDLIQAILAAAEDWAGSRPNDDVAMLVIERTDE